jgi:hypothetical protein
MWPYSNWTHKRLLSNILESWTLPGHRTTMFWNFRFGPETAWTLIEKNPFRFLNSSAIILGSAKYVRSFVCILKAHSHSKSGDSIWASLECHCCFWIAWHQVLYAYLNTYLAWIIFYIYNNCDITFFTVFILTHPVNFPWRRKPELPEKTHVFGRALTDSFHMSP